MLKLSARKIEGRDTGQQHSQTCPHRGTDKSSVELEADVELEANVELEARGHRHPAAATRNCLKVFFDWMVIEGRIPSNPVKIKYSTRKPQVSYYPPEVVKPLCEYMTSPDAEPTEALILYLIIFHGLSGDELRRALIPSEISKAEHRTTLADAYHLLVPAPPISCHNHSPGQPGQRVGFLPECAGWLKPLLERFEQQRQLNLSSESNPYLLVAAIRKKHNVPVGRCFVRLTVRRASLRILNAICLPRLLRMTSAVMIVQRGGAGCLMLMAREGQQAFVYSWAPRRIVHPKVLTSGQWIKSNRRAL
jgi:hypothetical protein